ncbi:hypothetical protein Mapa_001679 [Marchantia paleacea]|nr:hypothetical protein Mapa_001679 [Marchantia paleacea]
MELMNWREQMLHDRDGLIRVSLEGNIGVGKSTMLYLLQRDPRLQRVLEVLEEPADSWKNVNGTGLNMLQAYYEDPVRYAYLFQSYVFITRLLLHKSAARKSQPAILLTERSVSTDRVVFVEALLEQGYLDGLEAVAYDAWYSTVINALPNILADCYIYLRASPNVCYERLKSRARSKEAGVDMDYLQLLHQKHDDWFLKGTSLVSGQDGHDTGSSRGGHLRVIDQLRSPCGIQGRSVLVIDCSSDLDMAEQSAERDAILDQIVTFLLSRLTAKSQSADICDQVTVEFEQILINSQSHHQGNSQAPAAA